MCPFGLFDKHFRLTAFIRSLLHAILAAVSRDWEHQVFALLNTSTIPEASWHECFLLLVCACKMSDFGVPVCLSLSERRVFPLDSWFLVESWLSHDSMFVIKWWHPPCEMTSLCVSHLCMSSHSENEADARSRKDVQDMMAHCDTWISFSGNVFGFSGYESGASHAQV